MSITNSDMILGALQLLSVAGETVRAPNANQGEHGLSVLNDMFFEWQGLGIDLEWSFQNNLTDTCPVDEKNIQTVKTNLAVRLADTYGKPLSPITAGMAVAGFERLARDAALASQQTQTMENLPLDQARFLRPLRILQG